MTVGTKVTGMMQGEMLFSDGAEVATTSKETMNPWKETDVPSRGNKGYTWEREVQRQFFDGFGWKQYNDHTILYQGKGKALITPAKPPMGGRGAEFKFEGEWLCHASCDPLSMEFEVTIQRILKYVRLHRSWSSRLSWLVSAGKPPLEAIEWKTPTVGEESKVLSWKDLQVV